MSDDPSTTAAVKSPASDKLESLPKEELVKLFKNQILKKKSLETKLNELTIANVKLCQTEEQLRNELEDTQLKITEFDQVKQNEVKLQQELNTNRESLECFRLQNETLKTTYTTLQDDISNLSRNLNESQINVERLTNEKQTLEHECEQLRQSSSSNSTLLHRFISTTIDTLQFNNEDLTTRLSQPIDESLYDLYNNELQRKQFDLNQTELLYDNLKQSYDNNKQELNDLRQRLEDIEFNNEELKSELEDLRSKSKIFDKEKRAMQIEIDGYRRQVEDFEEQFYELQRESRFVPDTVDKSQQPSAASSIITLNTVVPEETVSQCVESLLDHVDEQHSMSKTSSVLLSSDIPTLLHSVGITNCTDEFPVPLNFESVLRLSTLLVERCHVLQYLLLKQNDSSTDEPVLIDGDEQCQVLIQRHHHSALDTIFQRLQTWTNGSTEIEDFNEWQLTVTRPIDQNTNDLQFELNNLKFVPETNLIQIQNENHEQNQKILTLENRLHTIVDYEQLKERQNLLEQQLTEQCEKAIAFENLLKEEHIDKEKIAQLKQIESSYHELEEKFLIIKQLEDQICQYKIEYNTLQEHFNNKEIQLLEQREIFKIEHERQRIRLMERDDNFRMINAEYEQCKSELNILKTNLQQQERQTNDVVREVDERLRKQQQQLSELLEEKTTVVKTLSEQNSKLESDLSNNNRLLFEQTKLADDLDRRLQTITIESTQIIDDLRQQIKQNNRKLDEKNELQKNFEIIREEKVQIEGKFIEAEKTSEHLREQLESSKHDVQQFQIQYEQSQTNNLENIQLELENLRRQNDELNQKLEIQTPEPGESVQELKEKYNKMKVLLTRLKRELQDKNQQQPKQSLMDLELADYEKTIKNLKEELILKEKELNELRDELIANMDKYSSLKIEINNLEQQKFQTDERANKFKSLLDIAKKELQNAKDLEQERHSNDDNVRSLLDTFQKDLDNNKVLINELLNEKQQLTERINTQSDVSQRAINMLEQNLRIAKHDLDIAKQDYDTLQDDFNGYKIRAQSVLKQHQSQSGHRERTSSVADKQVELEETIEKLKTALREANDKLQAIMTENDALQKEQDRLVERQSKLVNESRKREQDLRKQHQIELDKLENENLQQTNDNNDMIKNVTLQNETLSTAFKEQIAAIEADHERSISLVQNQLQTSRQEIEQLKTRIESIRQSNVDHERSTASPTPSQTGILSNESNRNDLAWTSSERQQGEGSEAGSTDHQSTDVAVKTLEYVLSGGGIQNGPSTNVVDKPRHILFEDIEIERQRIQEELNKTKLRLLNTTELLNESELNNIRLEEQVSLLKDEIRRIERNMDRAESISNLEYLKNIIFKFFILKSIPERLQLIPVLVTMLKLSPDEQAKLVRVAQMTIPIEENPLNSETSASAQQLTNGPDSTAPSWGSYLHIW